MSDAPDRLAPAPFPADIGVVTALPMEAGHLIDRMAKVRRYTARSLTVVEGELEGRLLVVLAAGVGRASARRGVEHLLEGEIRVAIWHGVDASAAQPAAALKPTERTG